jgi:hypothetical protein
MPSPPEHRQLRPWIGSQPADAFVSMSILPFKQAGLANYRNLLDPRHTSMVRQV